MNNIYTVMFCAASLMFLAACGNGKNAPAPAADNAPEGLIKAEGEKVPASNKKDKKILVTYFSHSGNTRNMAEQIASASGADIFEITPVKAYPSAYGDCVDQAKKEQQENARPALSGKAENMADYDIVFVGYPNWWGTMPMPVFTFLESYDFAGKTVIPFCTHEGSRMGRSEGDIKKLLPSAEVKEGMPVRGSKVKTSGKEISAWVEQLGLAK